MPPARHSWSSSSGPRGTSFPPAAPAVRAPPGMPGGEAWPGPVSRGRAVKPGLFDPAKLLAYVCRRLVCLVLKHLQDLDHRVRRLVLPGMADHVLLSCRVVHASEVSLKCGCAQSATDAACAAEACPPLTDGRSSGILLTTNVGASRMAGHDPAHRSMRIKMLLCDQAKRREIWR